MTSGVRAALANPFAWLLVVVGGLMILVGRLKLEYAIEMRGAQVPNPDDLAYTYALINEGFSIAPWLFVVGVLCIAAAVLTMALHSSRR